MPFPPEGECRWEIEALTTRPKTNIVGEPYTLACPCSCPYRCLIVFLPIFSPKSLLKLLLSLEGFLLVRMVIFFRIL